MLVLHAKAQLIEADTFLELQNAVNPYWTDGDHDEMHRPGVEFIYQLPMMVTGSTFPQSFHDALTPIQEEGITLYQLQINESETVPAIRSWQALDGTEVDTSNPPLGYNPQQWVLNTFPPPAYLSPTELETHIYDRRPSRKTLRLKLIRSVDIPSWEQAMVNRAIANNIPQEPENLDVSSMRLSEDGLSMELLIQIPLGISQVGLYSKDQLSSSIQWIQKDTIDIVSNPQWIYAPIEANVGFHVVGNQSLDSDLDGLSDVWELFIGHTSTTSDDSDGDGINDHEEIYIYETDANNADTDGDGLEDGFETEYGGNPHSGDSDGDRRPDSLEDSDGDGLNARMEQARGTNPSLKDTDGDLVFDADAARVSHYGI